MTNAPHAASGAYPSDNAPGKLTADSYGKSRVRLTRLHKEGEHYTVKQLIVDTLLEGEFAPTYTEGDNASVIPTDTQKNTVYVLAGQEPIGSVELFAKRLVKHFLDTYSHVSSAQANVTEEVWHRLSLDGVPHPHAFLSSGGEQATATYREERGAAGVLESGIDGLLVFKATGSGFVGYIQDEYTTLGETTDRIFSTTVKGTWKWNSEPSGAPGFESGRATVRDAILSVFAQHESPSVQQTGYLIGQAILEAVPEIAEFSFTMPNSHHLPVNLEPFGLENPNLVFHPVDEPYGLIHGTVGR